MVLQVENGEPFNHYTLKHINIFRGPHNLPKSLTIPTGPCGLSLLPNTIYLLSGKINGTGLSATRCDQLFNVVSPYWFEVSPSLVKELNNLQCSS
ncbi:unnamed protein product, partial [Mesorhabditis belari]|uniref:Uncharacterized protein n=1 Tax=Mesorhabditis belari TaxID=2138241 RepID=A0AAF3EEF0_9BILA